MSTVEILNQLFENTKDSINPTEIYNEGWMLNCVLEQIKLGKIENQDLRFPQGTKWYAEALLPTFFKAISQEDKYAEKDTHADGLVGHIDIREGRKRGIELQENCTCLYITEAKMFSKLSKGTSNFPDFDQCARNVACLMKLVYDWQEKYKEKSIEDIKKLGFYLLLPKSQRDKKPIFGTLLQRNIIKGKIEKRIGVYFESENIKKDYEDKKKEELNWAKNNLESFMNKTEIKPICWEELLPEGNDIVPFYEKCETYNKKKK
jgi:hypothetical protein